MEHTKVSATPGPWHATPAGHIASANHGFVPLLTPFTEDAHKDKFGNPTPGALANAYLAAAAPELLEALEELTPSDWSLNDPMSLKYGRARDAIKAAKGDAGQEVTSDAD